MHSLKKAKKRHYIYGSQNLNNQELFPAVHYIYCPEPRDNRMSFPSGLGHLFSSERNQKTRTLYIRNKKFKEKFVLSAHPQ
jgi:hypothetical protein